MTSPDFKRIVASVQIRAVRLLDARFSTSIEEANEVGETSLDFQMNVTSSDRPQNSVFFVRPTFRLEVVSKDEQSSEPRVRALARFEVQYIFPEAFDAPTEELRKFAEVNGLFNAWPYWRELVQNMTTRMGLPPLTMPLFRVADLKRRAEAELPTSEHQPRRPEPRRKPRRGR